MKYGKWSNRRFKMSTQHVEKFELLDDKLSEIRKILDGENISNQTDPLNKTERQDHAREIMG